MVTDKQRRAAEQRRLRRQQQRRAEQVARRRKFALIASAVGTLVIIAVVIVFVVSTNGDKSTPVAGSTKTPSPTATSAGTTAATASYPCTWTKSGAPAKPATVPSTTTPPRTGKVDLLVQTSRGSMTFALDRAAAPCTVQSFVSLAEEGYFNSTPCHRLTTSGIYVLQCGDPTGTGTGGPGYTVPDEAKGNETYPAGTIAMARTPTEHSGGSQFFIVYKDSPNLMQHLGALQYTVFGRVTSGMKIIDQVAAKGANPAGDGKPKLPVTLTNVAVVQ
ncbi:MAG TPA: peptidylprolyl isomerase [Jatrophihabitans sp.]|nr:peptidylprolyl isomerase [Jatrophihabitans sp.]